MKRLKTCLTSSLKNDMLSSLMHVSINDTVIADCERMVGSTMQGTC